MNLSISETNRFINAGKDAALNETHTSAGTDPIVIETIGLNPDSPAFPAIIEAWDSGYITKRAEMLVNLANHNE